MDPCPPRPFFAELNLPIRLAEGVTEPSTDEGSETVEPEPEADGDAMAPLPTPLVAAVQESLEPETETRNWPHDPETGGVKTTPERQPVSSPSTPTPNPKAPGTPKAREERVAVAESWVAEYCASKKTVVAPTRSIRAYRIWYENETLDPEGVAKLLREPPLKTNTVVSYILEAIRCENLPFEKSRLRNEILSSLSKEALEGRYHDLAEATAERDTSS